MYCIQRLFLLPRVLEEQDELEAPHSIEHNIEMNRSQSNDRFKHKQVQYGQNRQL